MESARPYRPRAKTDPRIPQLFWRGAYYGIVVGLLAGAALWGFLLLGGAPVAFTQTRTALTLLACGLFGTALIQVGVWGARGLEMVGQDLIDNVACRIEWLLWPFVPESEAYVREERVAAAAQSVARVMLAAPAGLPIMAALIAARKVSAIPKLALMILIALGAVLWLMVISVGWRWLMIAPPPPPLSPVRIAPPDLATQRSDAEVDSALQLAVARADRAKADGDNQTAIAILELALRDADAQGRSVAHLQVHWLLAWMYAEEGDVPAAMVMFRAVLDLADPDGEQHREARAALRRLAAKERAQDAGQPTRILQQDVPTD